MKGRILVVISSWPSKEHPYLVYLFSGLKECFPNMRLFLFKRVSDTRFAEELIGGEQTRQVLKGARYRFIFTANMFKYFAPLLKIAFHPIVSIKIYNSCLANGLSKMKAIGQLLYGYQIIGKKFDLVYINALQTGRHFAISSIFPNSKIIASSRGQDFDWHPERYDTLLSQLDQLHVLGTHLKKRAIERKFPIEKITIIPPASLPNKGGLQKDVNETNIIQIVTAARLLWTKGYVYSLRAISLLKEMLPSYAIRYTIMGDGEDVGLLKFEIKRLKLEEEVVLKGWINQDEVNQHFLASDIYLLLSIEEGFNNSVMQAQSLGLPCVVSDAGGLPDNVQDGVTGFVVPRYDALKAADSLYQLVVDRKKRDKMGKAAKVRMERDFSLAIQIDKYSELFKKSLRELE